MKYKIIPNDIVKNLIEFLDEIQFEAASGNSPDDLHKINFINWMISELMNGVDGFDSEDLDLGETEDDDKNNTSDRIITIDNYRKDLRKDFPDDMSEKEWKKLVNQFDAFIAGWDKAYKKSNHQKKAKEDTLKNFAKELKMDPDLTPEEKFELYYSEHKARKKDKNGLTYKQLLKAAGINNTKK